MRLFGWVVPWSGQVITAPDPVATEPPIPPVEVTPPDMTQFELQFEQAFPDPAAPEHINNGATFQWPALEAFVTQKAEAAMDQYVASTGGNTDEASYKSYKALLRISRAEEQTAWSSMVSLLQMYLYGFANRTNSDLQTLWAIASNALDSFPVWRDIAVQEARDYTNAVVRVINAEIQQVEDRLNARILRAAQVERQWTHDNVVVPLGEAILQEAAARQQADSQIVHTDIPAAVDPVAAAVMSAVAAQVAIRTAVATLQQESTDCTKPMCDTMGPKTDLGKFLKALSIGADLALFAELANLTESDVQALFAKVAHWAGVAVDAFDSTFVQSGGRLRDVLADVGL